MQACRQLGGVSVGGWIVLGLLIGFCCGVVSTVLFQWYRRRREEKYLLQVGKMTINTSSSSMQ